MEVLFDLALKYWVPVLFGGLTGCVTWMWKQLKAFRKGLRILLRNTIIKNHDDYMERGYIPLYAMENVTSAYEAYHALYEDATMTKFYEELKGLPSQPSQNKEKVKEKEEACNSCLQMLKEKEREQGKIL